MAENETPGQAGGSAPTSSVIAILDRITDPTRDFLDRIEEAIDLAGWHLIKVLDDKPALDQIGDKHAASIDAAYDATYDAGRALEELRRRLGGMR
jgi:hypothetical protein